MNDQAQIIYDALKDGDQEGLAEMRETVYASVNASDVEEFEADYITAYAQYQADHEMPEEEREQLMIEQVKQENDDAQEVIVEVIGPEEGA